MNNTISIDQNSHTLWDTVPKLEALAAHGFSCLHCLEDVDVAFTRHGAAGACEGLALERERCYRGGASDWGAALFYSDFLGRLPLDVRELESCTGWSTAALSRRLGCTVDALYDRYSPSDNWQLVGSSYADPEGTRHRVIGDLRLAEVSPFIHRLFVHARRDLRECFPEAAARARIDAWFDAEEGLVSALSAACEGGTLIDLYGGWLRQRVPGSVAIGLTSRLFQLAEPRHPGLSLLADMIAGYDAWIEAYNDAIAASGVGLKPLRGELGELPAVAIFRDGDRWQRADLRLSHGALACGDKRWPLGAAARGLPLEAMARDGVAALVGKALLLVIQVRLADGGQPLVLPYQGSLYMPAVHAFEENLRTRGLLRQSLLPVYRVRFRFFEHWEGCRTFIRPPTHVRRALGVGTAPAGELAAAIVAGARQAREVLGKLGDKKKREQWTATRFPALAGEIRTLEANRRELARLPEGRVEAGVIWDRVKKLERELLEKQVEAILDQMHLINLHYYDSRGALQPWSVALGGKSFYAKLLDRAEIYREQPERTSG